MTFFYITYKYLQQRKWATFLQVLLLGLGAGVVIFLMLIFSQLENNFKKNLQNIDLVIGAKGSPLQLVLANIYHLDVPTGNISLREADRITKNKYFVKKAIPLALGDSYKGFRVIGTNLLYPQNYACSLQKGKWFENDFEVVLGSQTAKNLQLSIGSTFFGTHGLQETNTQTHKDHAYRVVGIMNQSNTVLDRLILTSLESIWEMHEHTQKSTQNDTTRQVTAFLLSYKSQMANVQLPRIVNEQTKMQAASPAFELARMFGLLGLSVKIVQVLGYLLVTVAVLSIFVALYNALKERSYDLALMRTLGASKLQLFGLIILEGFLLAFLGGSFGLLLGHLSAEILGSVFQKSIQFELTGFFWVKEEAFVCVGVLLSGVLAALIPARQAYQVDIAKMLNY